MASRNYLQYNYDDFDHYSRSHSSSTVDLPAIAKNQYQANYHYEAECLNPPSLQEHHVDQYRNQLTEKFSKLYPQGSFEISQIFWQVFLWIALIPLVNSSISNVYLLTSNIFHNAELRSNFKKLNQEKTEVVNKIKEYNSISGMKRTIKEEIRAIEENEILVKIL